MILLRMSTWDVIRGQFNDSEKAALNAAISGETICPRGCTLGEEKLGPELSEKLKAARAAMDSQ
jgi:hypothetical protein